MHHLIKLYWQNVIARGDKPRPVYQIVCTKGGQQPIGYVIGWSINKHEAQRRAGVLGNCRIEKVLFDTAK